MKLFSRLIRYPAVLICLVATVILVIFYSAKPLGVKIMIGSSVYKVKLAITPREKVQGLSGQHNLPEGQGMLFVYTHKEQYNFWMKDMNFPLDFVWIADGKIVDLTQNVSPPQSGEQPVVVTPKEPVNQILELPAGTIGEDKIKIGDTVKIKF